MVKGVVILPEEESLTCPDCTPRSLLVIHWEAMGYCNLGPMAGREKALVHRTALDGRIGIQAEGLCLS